MKINTIRDKRVRTAAALALIGAALTSPFGVSASQPDEFEAVFQTVAAEVAADFKHELMLQIDASIRPPVLLEQNRVAAAEATPRVDQEKAQEPS